MQNPAELARTSGTESARGRSGVEEIRGYGVMGVPFESGDVLAIRRLPATSFGPSYSSVWHRAAAGNWTIYTTIDGHRSCPRYFGAAAECVEHVAVELDWTGPARLEVHVPAVDLRGTFDFAATPITRLMSTMIPLMPARLWRNAQFLSLMGLMSRATLGSGRMNMRGHVPNRQWYTFHPRTIYRTEDARASLGGRDFGAPAPLSAQAFLEDFPITQRGLLVFGGVFAEALDPSRHQKST